MNVRLLHGRQNLRGSLPPLLPLSVFCGGRLLNRIGRVQALSTEISQRRRAALKVWMDWGHAETELRALAKAHESLQPIAKQLKARK